MADIRIKDLTTTASSTASDDFIAVDGTTNGTRKLNAFSPTFGGNATVTGTLTVNGTGPHAFSGALTINPSSGDIQQNFQRSGTGKGIISVPGTAGNIVADSAVDDFVVRTTSGKAFRVTTDGGNTSSLSVATATVSVLATTASTTTSSGALVVGNGTSGGLGVGGAINAGGLILSSGSTAGLGAESRDGSGYRTTWYNPTGDDMQLDFAGIGTKFTITSAGNTTVAGTLTASGTGDSSFAGILRVNNGAIVASGASAPASGSGVELQHAGTIGRILAYNRTASSPQELTINHAGGNVTIGGTGTVTSILGTTASTSTSSGALVVSGGVGVAKNSWFGEELVTVGTFWNSASSNNGLNGFNNATTIASNVISVYGSTGSNNIQLAGRVTTFDGGSGFYGLNLQAPTSAYPDFSGTVNFTNALTLTSQLATFATAIKTAAPSGGTAAAWKLGTVATVSPTSPNRTIEVDIGGTIYYIHAKTTNN